MDDEEELNYAGRVGERLRLVRKQKHLSLQAVEALSSNEFKASVLGAYERGERTISVPRLQRLAQIYNVPVDQLLPRDLTGAMAAAMGTGSDGLVDESVAARRELALDEATGRVTIDLARLEDVATPERELLRRYLGMIQVQRQDFNGRVLTIRSDDMRAIGCLFDTTADGMRNRLDNLGLRQPV
ncbi:MAG TPA: transcriptional regulator [Acidimicrobiales bacterium]|nr:transcriptional regulator [Acidimicrobiales bacterium]